MTLSYIMPSISSWMTFFLSTTTVTLIGEILPQALVPLWILEVGGRSIWFLRCLMWILAVPACIPAYALRKARDWHGRKHSDKRDGVLELDELMEFVRLHQHCCGHSGPLTDECGSLVRAVLSSQRRMILDEVKPWRYLTILDVNVQLDAMVLENIWSWNDPYVLVVKNTITEGCSHSGDEDESEEEDGPTLQVAENDFMQYGVLLRRVHYPFTINIASQFRSTDDFSGLRPSKRRTEFD